MPPGVFAMRTACALPLWVAGTSAPKSCRRFAQRSACLRSSAASAVKIFLRSGICSRSARAWYIAVPSISSSQSASMVATRSGETCALSLGFSFCMWSCDGSTDIISLLSTFGSGGESGLAHLEVGEIEPGRDHAANQGPAERSACHRLRRLPRAGRHKNLRPLILCDIHTQYRFPFRLAGASNAQPERVAAMKEPELVACHPVPGRLLAGPQKEIDRGRQVSAATDGNGLLRPIGFAKRPALRMRRQAQHLDQLFGGHALSVSR